jgi:hypothetical protein
VKPLRIGALRGLVFALGLVAVPAQASDEDPLAGRWLPSVALGFDVQVERNTEATVSSSQRGTFTDDRDFLTSVPGTELELMTPTLGDFAGAPRLFVFGEWVWGWEVAREQRPVVKEGTIGSEVLIPPRCQPGNPTRCSEALGDLELVEGMGSRLDASIENGWTAGLGMAVTVPVSDWFTVIVKPSVVYHGEEVELEGEVKDPFLIVGSSPPNDNVASYTSLGATESEVFHAVGGRLAIEYEAFTRGSFDVLVYVRGQAFWWLDDEVRFGAANATDEVTFEYVREDMVWNSGVGFRIRWRGP